MKVKITNKKLWNNFSKMISIYTGVISLVLSFIDFEQNMKICIAIFSIVVLILTFLVLWYRANKLPKITLKINDTNFNICFDDLFKQKDTKIIAFNEFFDTKVDDKIIAKSTLNGCYLNNYVNSIYEVDCVINNNERIKKYIIDNDVSRKYGGKSIKYKLGTLCPKDDFLLLAFTHFNEENQAFLTVEEYISALMHMWNELDVYYAGKSVSLPLLGAGMTRFKNARVSEQELLEYIVMTFKASKIKLNNGASVNVILYENVKEKINLYDIKEK